MIKDRDMIFNGPDGRIILRKANPGQRSYPTIDWVMELAAFCAKKNYPPPHVIIVAGEEWDRLHDMIFNGPVGRIILRKGPGRGITKVTSG